MPHPCDCTFPYNSGQHSSHHKEEKCARANVKSYLRRKKHCNANIARENRNISNQLRLLTDVEERRTFPHLRREHGRRLVQTNIWESEDNILDEKDEIKNKFYSCRATFYYHNSHSNHRWEWWVSYFSDQDWQRSRQRRIRIAWLLALENHGLLQYRSYPGDEKTILCKNRYWERADWIGVRNHLLASVVHRSVWRLSHVWNVKLPDQNCLA